MRVQHWFLVFFAALVLLVAGGCDEEAENIARPQGDEPLVDPPAVVVDTLESREALAYRPEVGTEPAVAVEELTTLLAEYELPAEGDEEPEIGLEIEGELWVIHDGGFAEEAGEEAGEDETAAVEDADPVAPFLLAVQLEEDAPIPEELFPVRLSGGEAAVLADLEEASPGDAQTAARLREFAAGRGIASPGIVVEVLGVVEDEWTPQWAYLLFTQGDGWEPFVEEDTGGGDDAEEEE